MGCSTEEGIFKALDKYHQEFTARYSTMTTSQLKEQFRKFRIPPPLSATSDGMRDILIAHENGAKHHAIGMTLRRKKGKAYSDFFPPSESANEISPDVSIAEFGDPG